MKSSWPLGSRILYPSYGYVPPPPLSGSPPTFPQVVSSTPRRLLRTRAHTHTYTLSLRLSFSSVHPPMPYNITIANSTVAVALTAVKFGRRKSEGDSPRADTNARDYARLSLREHRPPAPCPLFRFSILVDRDLMPILISRNGRNRATIVHDNRSSRYFVRWREKDSSRRGDF